MPQTAYCKVRAGSTVRPSLMRAEHTKQLAPKRELGKGVDILKPLPLLAIPMLSIPQAQCDFTVPNL